jgi:hypothetical protein
MNKIPSLTPKRYGQWAVITGGSSGIGFAHAAILADHGFNIVIAARDTGRLEKAADKLRGVHGVQVESVVADLGEIGGAEAVIAASSNKDIGVFIGNAGAVTPGYLHETGIADLEKCVSVKIRSNLVLTHHFAGLMRRQGRGAILLVSSIGGRQGIPYLANNAAAEAYVLTLGEGLHHELKPLGVNVTTLLPGPTATPAFYRMAKNPNKRPKGAMSADAVAHEGLQALVRGDSTHIAGRMNRLMSLAMSRKAMSKLMGKMMAGMFDIRAETPAAAAPMGSK